MMLCNNLETISIITYNLVIALSVLLGGGWALFIYMRRHEDVALDVKISKIEPNSITDEKKTYLLTNVIIKNTGKRDVDLLFRKAEINIIKTKLDGTITNNTTDKQVGLTSIEQKTTGRLRSGVEITFPYWLSIKGNGLYFIEFQISVDMRRYLNLQKRGLKYGLIEHIT